MGKRIIVESGDVFHALTAVREVEPYRDPSGQPYRKWSFRCICGNETEATLKNVRKGHTRSCGCAHNLVQSGERHSSLVAVCREDDYIGPAGYAQSRWRWRCDCGNDIVCSSSETRSGKRTSCGCKSNKSIKSIRRREHPREYKSWCSMKSRCNNEDADNYNYYGGRGIRVCGRWMDSFAAFLADMGDRPEGMTLDRKDPEGHYEPDNCRWATAKHQMRNKRSSYRWLIQGKTYETAALAAKAIDCHEETIRRRCITGEPGYSRYLKNS